MSGEVRHGELSSSALEDSVRKLVPAIDYLVHGLIGMPRTNDRSFGECLDAIVGRCCQSFDLHIDDLFAIMDDRIFRELGERLSEWRRLSQLEAQSHHSAPFPDIRILVDGPHVYTLLLGDAHHRQIARSLAAPSLLANRGPKGDTKDRKSKKKDGGDKRTKKAPTNQTPPKVAKVQHTSGSGQQPAVVARAGGSSGSRRLSIYGTSATGPQIDELWSAFDAAIALCGPWASNCPEPTAEALLPLLLPRRKWRWLQRAKGRRPDLRQATRDLQVRAH